ncbi:probable Squamosa promoter-binding-like protein 7 at N-terminal half [Coccomyxa sp. Obi]|nr:probable Squamosa promoter-binding-like protein 7 at N-terminal half [Coccomyxa sp. Obi]
MVTPAVQILWLRDGTAPIFPRRRAQKVRLYVHIPVPSLRPAREQPCGGAVGPLLIRLMSTTSSEERPPTKRQREDPQVGPPAPHQWTVKRPRTGSATAADIATLIGTGNAPQRSERAVAAGQGPSGGQGTAEVQSTKQRRSQTSARPFTCQVEDCTRDVCELSTYHFRYRICNVHIRLPAFMRQGKLQRFCQQCGRCHELSEFEGSQRSCRAQLDRHNARRRQAKKNAAAAKGPAAGSAHAAMGTASGHHSSSTSLPASSSGGAPRAGRSGSGDAAALGQRRGGRGPARSAAADAAAADEEAAADAATLLSVSQPRPALLPSEHLSRLGSSRLSAFAQYSGEPADSLGGDRPAAVRGGGATDRDWGEDAKRRSMSRQNSEHSCQPEITSSSESAAAGVYESSQGARDRAEAEEATSRAAQARRHSQSVGEEAGSVRVAVRSASGDMPATIAVERLASVSGSVPRSAVGLEAVGHSLGSAAAMHGAVAAAPGGGQPGKDGAEGDASKAEQRRPPANAEGPFTYEESAVPARLRHSKAVAHSSRFGEADTAANGSSDASALPALLTAAVAALQEAGGAGADQPDSKPHASLASVDSESAQMGPMEPQPTPFSALASSSLSEAPATQLSISPKGPEATSTTNTPHMSSPAIAATGTKSGSLQASRSLSESMVPSEGPPSWASSAKRSMTLVRPLDPAAAPPSSPDLLAARSRLALERNASVLRGLQQSKVASIGAAGRQVSSSASIALTQRGNSTQSSMDLYVPDIGASAAASAASAGPAASDAPAARPVAADKSPSKPPPFPQLPRAGQTSHRAAGEGTPQQQEEAVRHWLQFGQQFAPLSKVPGPPLFPGAAAELAMPAVKAAAPAAAAAAAALSTQTVAYLDGGAQAGQASGDAAAAAEAALPAQLAAKQERHLLAASLPEGLRTALGLSMGQPVGQPQRKGTQVDVQPVSADAPASGAEAPGPAAAATAPSLLSQAEAAAAAAALPQFALQAQLAASAAAAQQPLYMPMARGAAQMAMVADQQAGGTPGAAELPALNSLSYQLYQMLMGSLLGNPAPKQPVAQFPDAMAASVAAAVSAAGSQARAAPPAFGSAGGGAAAMAQLMSFRAEAFAVHLCVKLFHCSPADLPEDVREQLLGWLQAAPACTELYIRSGCVHVTVTAYVDVMTYQQVLSSGAVQMAQHLLRQPSNVWRKGVVLVEVMNKAVLVSDGVPGAEFGLDAVCSGAFSRVEPPVAMAGQVCILEAHGGPAAVNANDCTVLCRAHGRYFETQVEAVAGLGCGTGRKFLVRLPPDMPAGVAYLELQQGPFVGGACPALVMPPELAAAAGELLHALHARDALLKCSSSDQYQAVARATTDALLCQMGLLMQVLSQQSQQGVPDLAPSSALPRPDGVPESLGHVSPLQQPIARALAFGTLQFACTWGLPHLSNFLLQSANFTPSALEGRARQLTPEALGDRTNAYTHRDRPALPPKDAGASGLDVLARLAAQAGQQPLPVGQA